MLCASTSSMVNSWVEPLPGVAGPLPGVLTGAACCRQMGEGKKQGWVASCELAFCPRADAALCIRRPLYNKWLQPSECSPQRCPGPPHGSSSRPQCPPRWLGAQTAAQSRRLRNREGDGLTWSVSRLKRMDSLVWKSRPGLAAMCALSWATAHVQQGRCIWSYGAQPPALPCPAGPLTVGLAGVHLHSVTAVVHHAHQIPGDKKAETGIHEQRRT